MPPKLPAYGDRARLEQLASGLKHEGGTHGPLVQRNPAGRPQGSTTTRKQPSELPAGFKESVSELATGEAMRSGWGAVLDYWDGLLAQSPTPFVQMMRDMAAHMTEQQDAQFALSAAKVYHSVPNFEV